jgi:hypothetical protein
MVTDPPSCAVTFVSDSANSGSPGDSGMKNWLWWSSITNGSVNKSKVLVPAILNNQAVMGKSF